MKRSLFFILSAVVVLILLAVWAYILFFSTNSDENTQETSDPEISNNANNVPAPQNEYREGEEPLVDVEGEERLRQLVLDPVIGFQEVMRTPSSTPEFYYINAGVGHILSINLESGEESRVSNTTIPEARKGVITHDGKFALVQSGRGGGSEYYVVGIKATSTTSEVEYIDEVMEDFAVTTDNTFLYTTKTNSGLVAKQYYPISQTSRELFRIPFREATVDWGDKGDDTHYVYPPTTSRLEGYLYASQPDGTLSRIPPDGFGLAAIGNNNQVVFSVRNNGSYQTFSYNLDNNEQRTETMDVIPDKCAPLSQEPAFVCGAERGGYESHNTPDRWYEGSASYQDGLWKISFNPSSVSYLSDIFAEVGQKVDVINMAIGHNDRNVYFQNKNDQTVWMYNLR